jgi:predicted nucleotidyltransferase
MDIRPKKTKFSLRIQKELREKAIKLIKEEFLPDKDILKIILIGSSVKGNFGQYDSPGFRRSLYSDFDFIFLIKDNYKIPNWLKKEPSAKPFLDNRLNLTYRNKKVIDNKYDIEIFFIRETDAKNKEIQKLGEKAGIAITKNTKNKYIVIYKK